MFNPEKENLPSQEVEKSLEKEKPKLSYDDCLYLHQESIGLRHVLGRDAAEKERTQGVEHGDAIAVGSFTNLIRPEEMEELKNSIKDRLPGGLSGDKDSLKYLIEAGFVALPEPLKEDLTARFRGVVKDFIDDSLMRDMLRLKPGEALETYFLMGKFQGAKWAHEEPAYPMGKCGKQDVPPKNIYDFFTIDRADFNNLMLKKDWPVHRNMGDEQFPHTTQMLYDKFLDKIHELRGNKEKKGA